MNKKMMMRHLQRHLKLMILGLGMFFTVLAYGQSRTDDELYAVWTDKSKPETERLEAIWERMNISSMPNQEPKWWKRWRPEIKEAIDLAIKNSQKGYLPLFYYMFTIEDCAGNTECMCTTAKKVIESAKIANASKLPVTFGAYFILIDECGENVKEEDIITEFNKFKSAWSDKPEGIKMLGGTSSMLGGWYMTKEKYPKALTYLLESLRLSEALQLYLALRGFVHEKLG